MSVNFKICGVDENQNGGTSTRTNSLALLNGAQCMLGRRVKKSEHQMIVDMVRHFVTFQFLFQELQFCGISSNMFSYEEAQWPHSHILMTGGGGGSE